MIDMHVLVCSNGHNTLHSTAAACLSFEAANSLRFSQVTMATLPPSPADCLGSYALRFEHAVTVARAHAAMVTAARDQLHRNALCAAAVTDDARLRVLDKLAVTSTKQQHVLQQRARASRKELFRLASAVAVTGSQLASAAAWCDSIAAGDTTDASGRHIMSAALMLRRLWACGARRSIPSDWVLLWT